MTNSEILEGPSLLILVTNNNEQSENTTYYGTSVYEFAFYHKNDSLHFFERQLYYMNSFQWIFVRSENVFMADVRKLSATCN